MALEVADTWYDTKSFSDDVTLISYGAGMRVLNAAAEELSQKGVSAEVIDLRSLSPIDFDTLQTSVEKTNRVLALDTARRTGGLMAEIAAELQERSSEWLDGPVVRVGAEDVPWPYNRGLEQESYPQTKDIMSALETHFGI